MIAIEQKIMARRLLHRSAKHARANGLSKDQWMNISKIQNHAKKYELRKDILVHIGAMVWTLMRLR